MNSISELLPGVFRIDLKRFEDQRGSFVKTFSHSVFRSLGITVEMKEEFYSVSHKNVIRGMHFQVPPEDHAKVVFCAAGAVKDVVLDLRKGSGYGRVAETILSAEEPAVLVIPKGFAHGFLSLEDNSLMVYKTSGEYSPVCDLGILWKSIPMDWRLEAPPVVSQRDQQHPAFSEFCSPF